MGHKSKNSTLSPLDAHSAVQHNYNQSPSQAIQQQQLHHYGGIGLSGISTTTQSHNSNSNISNSSNQLQSQAQMSSSVVGSLLSPNQSNNQVTSSFSEYRFRPEVVTTSNRIQESCI